MPRKIQTSYTKSPTKTITVIGDSHTYNTSLGVPAHKFYPARLQALLNARGASVKCRNFGISGNTTSDMIGRKACLDSVDVPDLVIMYAGPNDTSSRGSSLVVASPSPTTTTASVTAAQGAYFAVGSYVTINSQTVRITARSTDALTWTPALSGAPSTGDTVQVATTSNLTALGNYVIAAQVAAGKTPRLVIPLQHYLNFASGGDTVGTPYAPYVTLRAQQQAAVTALDGVSGAEVIAVSFWQHMANLITNATPVNGVTYTQGDFAWHVLTGNIHLNAAGESILADALDAAIAAETGWLDALTG